MKAVVQRVSSASVEVAGTIVGSVGRGYLVLLGVASEDQEREAESLARRIHELRVFEDDAGRMNRALSDVGGGVLAVPQFTLLANLRKGRRPDFLGAAAAEQGRRLFEHFVSALRGRGVAVATGSFGASMRVSLVNEGPATFVFDTTQWLAGAGGPPRSSAP